MKTSELDYHLPEDLIAQHGLPDRSASRLLVLHRRTGCIEHRHFRDVLDYFHPRDCLVINDSKVIPARFFARRATGACIEGLFLELTENGDWQVLLKNARRVHLGETLPLVHPDPQSQQEPRLLQARTNLGRGIWLLHPDFTEDHLAVLERFGVTPLPPYVHRNDSDPDEPQDRQRYQTVYARSPGSVAAPTAGLHFTDDMLNKLSQLSVSIARVTLHVGLGTFRPIAAEDLEDHRMHAEHYSLDAANAQIINRAIADKQRLIAVGTTSVRTLETLAHPGPIQPAAGTTKLFITPGYQFQLVDVLLTNFHLPRSSLLALVCAFAGTEHVLAAYRQAVQHQYRFYSYGDAMLII